MSDIHKAVGDQDEYLLDPAQRRYVNALSLPEKMRIVEAEQSRRAVAIEARERRKMARSQK